MSAVTKIKLSLTSASNNTNKILSYYHSFHLSGCRCAFWPSPLTASFPLSPFSLSIILIITVFNCLGYYHFQFKFYHLPEVESKKRELAEVCATLQDVRSVHLEESSLTLSSVIGLCLGQWSRYFFALCLWQRPMMSSCFEVCPLFMMYKFILLKRLENIHDVVVLEKKKTMI